MSLQELQIEIEGKLAGVCSALEALKDQQQILSDNAEKLRSSVKESVNGHAKSLRNREKQILRQIEVITAHQKSIVEIQIATALHSKGSLNATKSILARCEPQDSNTLSKIKEAPRPSQKPVIPMKLTSVQLEGKALSSAIMDFAKISIPCSITHQDSTIIPARMEEYEDSEHEVLHKSLRGSAPSSSLPESPLKITVCFPKLPTSGWLAHSNNKKTVINDIEKPLSPDVSSWLSNLRVSQSPEDERASNERSLENEDEDGFQMVHASSFVRSYGNRPRNSESSSIEIINAPEDICHVAEMDSYDFKESNSQWLRPPPVINISSIAASSSCQANELCNSFKDCVLDGICEQSAVEKVLQSARWLQKKTSLDKCHSTGSGKREALKHMLYILQSDSSLWLTEKSNPSAQFVTPIPSKRVHYRPRSNSWLKMATCVSHKSCSIPDLNASSLPNLWLLGKMKETQDQDKGRKQYLNDEIKGQLHPGISVDCLRSALAELEQILPRFGPKKDSSPISKETNLSSSPNSEQDKKMKKWLISNSKASTDHLSFLAHPDLPASVIAVAETDLNKWLFNKL